MNILISCLFAVAVTSASATYEIPSKIGGTFLEAIERHFSGIIELERTPNKAQSQDTINFEFQHLDLCGQILCISANLTKGSISGLNGYDVFNLDLKSNGTRFVVDIDIMFPTLQLVSAYYEMKGNIMEAIPLSGEGLLHFTTSDLRFWTTIIVTVSDRTAIENFEDSGFSVKSISSRTDFDGNIDGIFNAMVDELLADGLNRFNKAIAVYCGNILKEVLNPILK